MRGASAKPSVCSVTLWGSTASHAQQRPQPGSRGAGDRAQALLHERAVLAHERHEVGDRRERDEVELRLQLSGVAPGRPVERLGELVRDAGRAQLGRVATDRRVHDRARGQRLRRAVVVGHHHVHPQLARAGHLRTGGDPAVRRDQQSRARRDAAPRRARPTGRSPRRGWAAARGPRAPSASSALASTAAEQTPSTS